MANNRLYLCAVNEHDEIERYLLIAKNLGGEWDLATRIDQSKEFVESVNSFLSYAFINCCGVSIIDEYMDVPLPPVYVYNDAYEGKGHWEFIKEEHA